MQKKQTTYTSHQPAERAGSKAVDNAPSALEERLLNVAEVARILHVGHSTIYGLIQRGDLHSLHIGRLVRFRMQDVQRFIEKHAHPK